MSETSDVINSPWNNVAPPVPLIQPVGDVTLVEGQSFAISDGAGDMSPQHPHGVFYLDTRFLSRFELRINDKPLESVATDLPLPFAATFAGRVLLTDSADADIVIFRRRHVGQGLRERLTITNYELQAEDLVVELRCDADFADLFAVKENRVHCQAARTEATSSGALVFAAGTGPDAKRTRVESSEAPDGDSGSAGMCWKRTLAPSETWEVCIEVTVEIEGAPVPAQFPCAPSGEAENQTGPVERLARWQARLPEIETDHAELRRSVQRSAADLGALQIFDPDHPEIPIVAAGAPWFMTVFGRDSLLTSWMTLLADSSLARGVLQTLARFQGSDVNPKSEEEPGKILHEMRFNTAKGVSLSAGDSYYGSVDATPLFVMLLGEVRRWHLADDLVDQLLPHADRALDWIEKFGDRDGDGYVEYQRRSDGGLANQGWKDSWDAIRFKDTTLAEAPIALCEVQGYVYAAYLARAYFAREAGDQATFDRYRTKAADLRRRFNEDFWLDDAGAFALGLDGDKRRIDAVASNMGHCLWTGIVDPERAELVADRLLAEDMFSGWGIRTLASSMPAYNPVSYHNGSVWPHDNALTIAGLMRYGFTEHAHRVIEGQLAAAAAHGDRLPELFGGFSRQELPVPGSYPSACSPQAWAAAAPLLWLRSLLRVDPAAPEGKVWVAPVLPDSISHLSVHGISIGRGSLDIDVDGDSVDVSMSSAEFEVIHEARPPLARI